MAPVGRRVVAEPTAQFEVRHVVIGEDAPFRVEREIWKQRQDGEMMRVSTRVHPGGFHTHADALFYAQALSRGSEFGRPPRGGKPKRNHEERLEASRKWHRDRKALEDELERILAAQSS